ncbi:DUF4279 domain-containing protein [Lysobacter sp. CA199]|uniref:DUF4279 domain-containing protein n=1 Tax=Lysobacter sp. CA199 TaxID=3455608 RepID=UPI003F8D29D4
MPSLHHTTACLRIWGEDLIPDEVSALLGTQPSQSQIKGETIWVCKRTGRERIAQTGSWRLKAEDREPGDLEAQIEALFAQLSDDPAVWAQLQSRFELDLFCGLFMGSSNDGEGIGSRNLRLLGERGIELILDIYDPSEQAPAP